MTETQTVIVYSSQAEMLIDQSLMTGEFFAVFSGIVIGIMAFVLAQFVLRPNQTNMQRTTYNAMQMRRTGRKPSLWARSRPSNEVIGLIVGAIAGIAWSTWLLHKIG